MMAFRSEKCSCKRPPKGHFVVYAGKEQKRFVIPLSFMKKPIFQQLLEKSAEEYGFDYSNGIVLPCDESTFHSLTAGFLSKSKLQLQLYLLMEPTPHLSDPLDMLTCGSHIYCHAQLGPSKQPFHLIAIAQNTLPYICLYIVFFVFYCSPNKP